MAASVTAACQVVSRGLAWVLLLPIIVYRKFISPLTPPSCRFTPTCSAYAEEALHTLGAFRAIPLVAWRLLRCQPCCRGGYDPVPAPKRDPVPTEEDVPPGS